MSAFVGIPLRQHHDRGAVAVDRNSQADLEREIASVDGELRQGSGEYAAFAGGEVLTMARVQELLATLETRTAADVERGGDGHANATIEANATNEAKAADGTVPRQVTRERGGEGGA